MLGPALSEDTASLSGNTRWCGALEEWEARGDALDGEALTVILKSPWPWAEVALRAGGARTGHGKGDTPPVCRGDIWSAASRWSCSRLENMTHPRALTQRADSPSTRDSDHDRQMKPGNDHIQKHEREAIFKKTPVARGALLDIALLDIALLEKGKKCWSAQERSQRDRRMRAAARSDEAAAALDSNLRWRAVTPTLVKMLSCRHSRRFAEKARLRSEKLMCVCTRSPFIPALRGGVRVAKHARQLSLACFVNTRRWLGSRARSH